MAAPDHGQHLRPHLCVIRPVALDAFRFQFENASHSLHVTLSAITLTLGSGACAGTSMDTPDSLWRNCNGLSPARSRADSTFAWRPGTCKGDEDGHANTCT